VAQVLTGAALKKSGEFISQSSCYLTHNDFSCQLKITGSMKNPGGSAAVRDLWLTGHEP
jgi:hypothetical protein